MVKLREGRWSLLVPTSVGVRLTPENRQPVHTSTSFDLHATSAETNVGSIVSGLGLPVKVLTSFVAGSPISALIKADLRARGMDVEGPDREQGGPWGYRHQFNIADSGYAGRGPRVWNDRAGEVGLTLNVDDYDLQRIFADEGVKILHLSGLVAGLCPQTADFCVRLAEAAKANGTLVSFDLNYRESFWKGRETELRKVFSSIAGLADLLYGNEEDFQLTLGIDGPKAGGNGLTDVIDSFKWMIELIQNQYPSSQYIGTTLREVISANRHNWGMLLATPEDFFVAKPREIEILDRIGGGDASIGGVLYGLLRGFTPEQTMQFGWACGALAVTSLTDYFLPADEDQVWATWRGNARVKR